MDAADRKHLVRSVGWRQGLGCAWAHVDGAVFVFVYSTVLRPNPDDEQALGRHVAVFAAFLLVTGLVFGWQTYRHYRNATCWLEEEPTGDERGPGKAREVLSLPSHLAVGGLIPWALAALFFPLVDVIDDGSTVAEVVQLSVTIALGGVVSVSIAFLLMERTMRPLFALALDGEVPERSRALGVRPRLILSWALGSGVPLLGVAVIPLRGNVADSGPAIVGLALAGLVVGSLVTVIAARSLADPLDKVRVALARVQDGDLDVHVAVDDSGEVGMLQSGVNRMVEGLRERRRLADLFGRHVGVEVARRALQEGIGLDSEQREASALFVDVIGSTAMAEVLAPQEVVGRLNAFFDAVVAAVSAEGGWVNKFEGDGALCVFGAPATQPDHAARALRAARDVRERVEKLAEAHPGLDAAVGVSSGPLVAGNVGTEQRYEYTVIGRPVNEAARLSELAKSRDARVLASSGAIDRAGDEAARWLGLGTVALRGQQAPTAIYEPAVRVRDAATLS